MRKHAIIVGAALEQFEYLQKLFHEHDIETSYALTVTEGAALFAKELCHLLILYIPPERRENRMALLTSLRRTKYVPILLMTEELRDEEIAGLINTGVDICLPQDAHPLYVGGSALSLIRRYTDYNHDEQSEGMDPAPFQRGDIFIDPLRRIVEVRGEPVTLNAREFSLLLYLMRNPNIILSPEQICERAWDLEGGYGGDVSGPISILRRAIEPDPKTPIYIQTVHHTGYRFIPSDEARRNASQIETH